MSFKLKVNLYFLTFISSELKINPIINVDAPDSFQENLKSGNHEDILLNIFIFLCQLVKNDDYFGEKTHVPFCDAILQKIGINLYESIANSNLNEVGILNNLNLFIVSELYATGGHTRLLLNILEQLPGKKIIVITDVFNNYASGLLSLDFLNNISFLNTSFILLPNYKSFKRKTIDLLELLLSLNAKNVTILAHDQDVVAYTACNPSLPSKQVFIHHADHRPSLGATISHYIHVDLSVGVQRICNGVLNENPCLLHLTSSHEEERKFKFEDNEEISTVTSGNFNKFIFHGEFDYKKIVLEVLLSINGLHHHIGELSEINISNIKNYLIENRIDDSRFVYHGAVQSLAETLQNLNASIYFESAPFVGLTAGIEALSIGLPVVRFMYSGNDRWILREIACYMYPENMPGWFDTSGIFSAIQEATENINLLSIEAHHFYKENYSKNIFRERIISLLG